MEEKSEKPTQQRIKKAREKGEVPKSGEFSIALGIFGAILLLWGLHELFDEGLKKVFYSVLTTPTLEGAFTRAFSPLLLPMLLFLLGVFFIVIASNLLQTGWIWQWKKAKKKSRFRLFFTLLKLGAISLIGYFIIGSEKPTYPLLFSSPVEKQKLFFYKALFLMLEVCAVLLLLGMIDFFYQKWRFLRQMHMTRHELKEEKREHDGDRETKSRMRERR